jgi:2-aminoadipate transaminase
MKPLVKTQRERMLKSSALRYHWNKSIPMDMIQTASSDISWSHMGARASDAVIAKLMADAINIPGILSLAAGFTDNAVLPAQLIEEAVSELTHNVSSREFLQYGTNIGRQGLREQALQLLKSNPGEESSQLTVDDVFISNGSQQALYLAAQVLCNEGDIVLVEEPTYFVFLELLKGMNLCPISIPLNSDNRIDFKTLTELVHFLQARGEWNRVKMIYLIGYYSNPSSRSLSYDEKKQLGLFLQKLDRKIPVIEDAAYRSLYFDSMYNVPSLLGMPEWESYPVLYTGTFTKPFSTGLKVGYSICNSQPWLQRMLRVKGHQDFGTSNFSQAIVERVLESDRYQAHLEKIRAHYKRKMLLLDAALREGGVDKNGWSWDVPEGGLYLWLKGPDHVDTSMDSDFCKAALDEKILYVPGDLCISGNKKKNYVRLSFGALDESQLTEAGLRFAKIAVRFS